MTTVPVSHHALNTEEMHTHYEDIYKHQFTVTRVRAKHEKEYHPTTHLGGEVYDHRPRVPPCVIH
jgi:hypothetical protein